MEIFASRKWRKLCDSRKLSALLEGVTISMSPELRKVLEGLRSPWSMAALITVLLLEALYFRAFPFSWIFAAAAILLGAGCLALWARWMVRSAAFARVRYDLTRQAHEARAPMLEQLNLDLQQLGSAQGVAQLDQLQRKFDSMISVLSRRLDAGELTYSRYLDTAEQVYLSAIDNLHDVAISLRSVSTIDRGKLDGRLSDLRGGNQAGPSSQREIETLEQRRALLTQQTDKVSNLLVQNETALTALDHAATALADARMGKGSASVELEHALQDLDQLARRAGRYAALSRQ
jgi:hypothetical protein